MKNNINIAIIGLGQIGIYLYNELKTHKVKKINEQSLKQNFSFNSSYIFVM